MPPFTCKAARILWRPAAALSLITARLSSSTVQSKMASNFTSTSAAGGGGGGGRGGGTSAFKMHVTPENTGLWGIRQTEEAAKKVTELLQEDMEHHHVFFNKDHFHNHIPHHLLALYGTHCTSPALLQTAYNNNTSYQRPALSPHEPPSPPSSSPESKPLLISPSDPWPSSALKYLGNETYYPDFLLFFQTELDKHGPQHVLTKYLFDDDQQMLPRLWSGVLHPLIQLMYGVEFSQPAIIAEALAQTAVHSNQLVDYLHSSESRSLSSRSSGGQNPGPMPAILDLLSEIRNHPTLSKAARPSDDQKIFDGVLGRAKEDMIALAAKVRVAEDEVEERTAEMFHEAVYVASVAARSGNLKWGKESSKFDFFLMHHVNSSPIFAEIANNQSWIPAKTKARLLEWKIRMDLLQYAARGCPELFGVDALNDYKPKHAKEGETVEDIISRLHKFPDDGHSIKLGRAAVICRNVCKKYEDEGKDWLRIKGEETWKKVCHLIVDSVEAPGDTWVRSAGFEEAWKDIADAKL